MDREKIVRAISSSDFQPMIYVESELDSTNFHLSTEVWVKILYQIAATFHAWKANRYKLLDLMTPLYFARVASFVLQSREMSSSEAEELVEEQAVKFEEQKDYLIKVWAQKNSGSSVSKE